MSDTKPDRPRLPDAYPLADRVEVPADLVKKLGAMCREENRFHDAWVEAQAYAPIQSWRGEEALDVGSLIAARLLWNRLSDLLDCRMIREAPETWRGVREQAIHLANHRSVIAAWRYLDEMRPRLGEWRSKDQAVYYSLQADFASRLRDFDTAEALLREAEKCEHKPAWMEVEWSDYYASRDDHERSLVHAERALDIQPYRYMACVIKLDALEALNRDDEVLAWLHETTERLQSPYLFSRLARMYFALERPEDAVPALEGYKRYSINPKAVEWYHASWFTVAYERGDRELALEHASKLTTEHWKKLTERIRQADKIPGRGVKMNMPAVRMHYNTCGPASMAAVTRFWGLDAEHREIVEEIWLDGTSGHNERQWAEKRGLATAEFRVTWEASRQLLDAGLPFMMSTVGTTGGHLQSIYGYDDLQDILIVREPSLRDANEFIATTWLKGQEAFGPRGFIILPQQEAARLEEIDLPERGAYDRHYRLQVALEEHRREDATEELRLLEAEFPDSDMTVRSRLALAIYDQDEVRQLEMNGEMLKRYPKDDRWDYRRMENLRSLGRRAEVYKLLEAACRDGERDAVFLAEFAFELAQDGGRMQEARRCFEKAMGRVGPKGWMIRRYADSLVHEGRKELALRLHRFASCLEPPNSAAAYDYFSLARLLKREEEALEHLRRRVREMPDREVEPVETLFDALRSLDREAEALAMLEAVLEEQADNPNLDLFAAEKFHRYGQAGRAAKLLDKVADRGDFRRVRAARARLAADAGELERAMDFWREVLQADPLNVDAHRALAKLLEDTGDTETALKHLSAVWERHPSHGEISRLYLQWLKGEDDERAEEVIRRLLQDQPHNSWAHRERSIILNSLNRYGEALEEAETAMRLDEKASASHGILGDVLAKLGRTEEAREAYRESVRIDIDYSWGIDSLFELAPDREAKLQELDFVHRELVAQNTYGQALIAFADNGDGVWEPERMLEAMQAALAARPDLWEAHVVVINQRAAMHDWDAALEGTRVLCDRFPMTPGSWRKLAYVHKVRQEWEEQAKALEETVRLSPSWSSPIGELAECYQRLERETEAEHVLQRGLRRLPRDLVLHRYLAELWHDMGREDDAVARLRHILTLSPHDNWAWDKLRGWGDEEEAIALARELAGKHTQTPALWMQVAYTLPEEKLEEILEALGHAAAIDETYWRIYDFRAFLLCTHHHYSEALAACREGVEKSKDPYSLRLRESWVTDKSGDREKALEMMREILADNPNSFWGQELRSTWADEAEEYEEALQAAREMARLNPDNAISYGFQADALRQLNRPAEAAEALEKALRFDPEYPWATNQLFELYCESERWDDALRLAEERHEVNAGHGLQLKLRLQIKRKNLQHDDIAAYGRMEGINPESWMWMSEELKEAGKEEFVWHQLDRLVKDGTANAASLKFWIRRGKVRDLPYNRKTLKGQIRKRYRAGADAEEPKVLPEAVLRSAVRDYLDLAGGIKDEQDHVFAFCQYNREWFVAEPDSWGIAGYALVVAREFQHNVSWQDNWREVYEQKLEAWMLQNYRIALYTLGHADMGDTVGRYAVNERTDWNYSNSGTAATWHGVILALSEAMQGTFGEAADRVPTWLEQDGRTHMKWFGTIIDVLREVHTQPRGELRARHAELKARIWEYLDGPEEKDHMEWLFARQALALLSTRSGHPLAWLHRWKATPWVSRWISKV